MKLEDKREIESPLPNVKLEEKLVVNLQDHILAAENMASTFSEKV